MSSRPILALSDVSFRYGPRRHWVLKSLSASIARGSVTAILGPNGVGKTTLLNLLLGLHPPISGQIRLEDQPLPEIPRRQVSRKIGYVPQLEAIPFPFRVLEYTAMGRAPHLGLLGVPGPSDYSFVMDVLGSLGLAQLSRRNVQELSGGEAQLVRIARALAQEPDILLLDEPTAHLDLANKEHMLQMLRGLSAREMTVVFTTHDPDAAFSIASHSILLSEGRALAAGEAAQVLTGANLTQAFGLAITVHHVNGHPVILRNQRDSE